MTKCFSPISMVSVFCNTLALALVCEIIWPEIIFHSNHNVGSGGLSSWLRGAWQLLIVRLWNGSQSNHPSILKWYPIQPSIHFEMASNLSIQPSIHFEMISKLSIHTFIHFEMISNPSMYPSIHFEMVYIPSSHPSINCAHIYHMHQKIPGQMYVLGFAKNDIKQICRFFRPLYDTFTRCI